MKTVVYCKTCNHEPFIVWEKPQITEEDCIDIINQSEHLSYDCEIYIKIYDNDNNFVVSISEPTIQVEGTTVETNKPWWFFWK